MRRLGMVLLAILFLFMVFAGPAAPKTDAVVVSTVVIGAVIAAMAAAGIGLTVSGMTSAQLSDWVGGKLNDWTSSLGGSVQDHIDNNLITVTARGILSIGTAAANGISDFISWLKNEDSITDNSTITAVARTSTLNGKKIVKLPTAAFRVSANATEQYTLANESDEVYAYYDPSSNVVRVFALGTSDATYFNWVSKDNGNTTTQKFYFYYQLQNGYKVPQSYYGLSRSIWEEYYDFGLYSGYPYQVFGNPTEPQTNGGLSYDTGTITVPTIGATDKWFIDVGADPGVTVDTVTDGVIADTIDGTLTVSGEVAEEEPEIEIDGPIGVSGLTEVFPFCIPFDVYALLSCLAADPQIPIFTVRFVIPGVINQEFTIDLTPFNNVAQIVRTMELIAFAIGLALVTRERFLRS